MKDSNRRRYLTEGELTDRLWRVEFSFLAWCAEVAGIDALGDDRSRFGCRIHQ
jgi:hypothetical protein